RELSTPEGQQSISFDRPTQVYVWVRAGLTLLPPSEQPIPVDGFELVTNAINETGQALEIGQDVIAQRFFCQIYQTPGIAEVDLQFAWSTDPEYVHAPEDYTAGNITIGETERAIFDFSRIEVT